MALENDPIDLLLTDDDLVVSGGDLQFSSGLTAVVQGIRNRLLSFRGEWFANLDYGVPWFQSILGQRNAIERARLAVRDAILASPGVVEIISLAVSFDASTRQLTITYEARAEFGDTGMQTVEV